MAKASKKHIGVGAKGKRDGSESPKLTGSAIEWSASSLNR